jgi:hypothetical protein
MLYLLANPTFISGSSSSSAAPAAAEEMVQRRWKPLSKRAIAKTLRPKMPVRVP